MSWDAIGALGEVIGALAVVVSLIYVGAQLRQSNALSKASAIHTNNAFYADVFSVIATDGELASIYQKATEGQELDPGEFARYTAFLRMYFAMLEDTYEQQKSGLYEVDLDSKDIIEFLAPEYSKLLVSRQSREWLRREANLIFAPDVHERFLRFLTVDESDSPEHTPSSE